jgi:hypothetical protein
LSFKDNAAFNAIELINGESWRLKPEGIRSWLTTILARFSSSDSWLPVLSSLELDLILFLVRQLTPSRLKSIIGLQELSVSAKALQILVMLNVSENY